MDRCIITAASNKFFPSLINFLGSLHAKYPSHPRVFVYDLGLAALFKKELRSISWVTVLAVPAFAPHWRSCYTWKTYILNTPLAESNLYIDAGSQVLMPLDALFEEIELNGYILVSQGHAVHVGDITPKEYLEPLAVKKETLTKEVVTAGQFGFKRNSVISPVTKALYDSGVEGLCLGFSASELWKNKGVNRTEFVRNCAKFRHDTTMLSLFVWDILGAPHIHPVEEFGGTLMQSGKQYILNLRMNFKRLTYDKAGFLHERVPLVAHINRLFIKIFYILKALNKMIKRI